MARSTHLLGTLWTYLSGRMHAKGRLLLACAIGVALVPTVPVTAQVPPLGVRAVRTVADPEGGRSAVVVVAVREASVVELTLRGASRDTLLLTRTISLDDSYRFVWGGTDARGVPAAPGTYVLEIDCACGRARVRESVELQVGGLAIPSAYAAKSPTVPPPTGLTVVAAQENLLSWTASPSADVSGYRIYRSGSADGTSQLLGATTELTFTDLPAEKAVYWYRVTAVVRQGKGRESAPTPAVSSDDVHLTQQVGPAGGTISPTTGTVELIIPAGALTAPVTFSVDQITPPAASTNRAVVTRVFEFGPPGTRFTVPATLRLRYEIPKGLELPSGYPEDATFMQVWNRSAERWEGVAGEAIDPSSQTISAPLPQLAIYAGGAVTEPHGGYSSETTLCGLCHLSHQAPGPNLHPYATEKETCYQCHDGTGANANVQADFGEGALGSSTKTSYHPVPAPVNGFSVTCGDCHTPHRLRTEFTRLLRSWDGVTLDPDGNPVYDYSTAASPIGNVFCYSCHGSTSPYPAPYGDHTAFETTAHNSAAMPDPPAAPAFPEGTGASSGIKCLTCHEQHASDQTHLTLSGKPQETLCYDCHTSGTPNTSGGQDPPWTAATGPFPGSNVFSAFNAATNGYTAGSVRIYHHPISDADQAGGTRKVECVSCHNSHLSDRTDSATTSKAANPANVFAKWIFGWDFTSGYMSRGTNVNQFCLNCHVNGVTTAPLNAGATIPYNVRMVNDGAAHELFDSATWPNSNHAYPDAPSTYNSCDARGVSNANCVVTCTNCHDPHGSTNTFMLRETVVPPDYVTFTVTNASWASGQGGVATLEYRTPSGLACTASVKTGCTVGEGVTITVTGVTWAGYNGTFVTTNSAVGGQAGPITYALTNPNGSGPTGGTVAPPTSYTMTGWDGSSTNIRAWCLTCHIERGTDHKTGACTDCHTHDISSIGAATQL